MAELTLGLDLGPNSIGWALIDETQDSKLVATGVRVFPEGVDRDQQGGEKSKNEQRRIARGMRRQIARRARRKRQLRDTLIQAGLFPPETKDQEQLNELDPYDLRRRALNEKLDLHQIGRVLVHLNQRRGFKSNRKADRARKKENSDMLKEISTLAAEVEAAGKKTIGEHFACLKEDDPHVRIRGHHTHRDMYEAEFESIWGAQQKYHPALLTEQLKYGRIGKQNYPQDPQPLNKDTNLLTEYGLYGIIFYQRPMYWPRSVVGQCELEPRKKRCPRADRLAQRFRLLQEVNNLRLLDSSNGEERQLTQDERDQLIAYLETGKERKFDQIRKHLGMLESVRFNLETGDRDKLLGMPTDAILANKNIFGKSWYQRPEDEKNRIAQVLLEDNEDKIRELATTVWGCNSEIAERLVDVDLGEGYSSYSREAIIKLLPHLEKGLPLTSRDGSPCALREAGYIMPWEHIPNQQEYLPPPPELTNPLVRQALHEVRKVLNAIIREYGKPARIHIELAREVKGTSEQRKKRSRDMRDRESARDHAAEEIRGAGIKVSPDAIERYLLWKEQKEICIYSGRQIGLIQLLSGEVHVDHILPRHRSLDNSMMNRVVCFRDENDDKQDRTPCEWLAQSDPAKYESILQRADKYLPYPKAKRFRQKSVELDDFFARQFVDTTYITTQVHQYVQCLGADVVCTKGQHTAELRRHWGLNSILHNDDLNLKNRDDHRHHAVDAIVIALTNRSRLQQLAGIRRQGGTEQTGEILSEPWTNFRHDVESSINSINVSHRAQRKVRGALHEETFYGPTSKPLTHVAPERPWAKNWVEKPTQFVFRKNLEELTPAMIDDIRDPAIRRIVVERLQSKAWSPGNKIPKDAWQDPLCMPSGIHIKKVRLLKNDLTIKPVRGGKAYVKTGSIHHLCIFEFTDAKGKTKRDAVFVSMLEAINRVKNHQPVIQRIHPERPDAKFIMSLSRGEMVLGTFKKQERLMVVRTSVSTEDKVIFASHTDARPGNEIEKISVSVNVLDGKKVIIDTLGRIRWAND